TACRADRTPPVRRGDRPARRPAPARRRLRAGAGRPARPPRLRSVAGWSGVPAGSGARLRDEGAWGLGGGNARGIGAPRRRLRPDRPDLDGAPPDRPSGGYQSFSSLTTPSSTGTG